MPIHTNGQLVQLLDHCTGLKYEVPIVLAATSGCRRGEILGLKWSDVDFERKTITICRSLEETRQGLFLADTKTPKSRRTIRLPDRTIEVLKEHKKQQDRLRDQLGESYKDKGLVCCGDDGNPMVPKNFSTAFRELVSDSDLPRIRLHDLRHTYISTLMELGAPVVAISAVAGHASSHMTMNVYGHVTDKMQEDTIRLLEDVLNGDSAEKPARD